MKTLFLCLLFLINLNSNQAYSAENHFALSSSGGISLGSYQAGRLYYQNHVLMLNGLKYAPSVFTGASAGSINSFLSLMDICQNKPRQPYESLYWKAWIPVGFNSLIPAEDSNKDPANALFSNAKLQSVGEEMKKEWMAGLPEDCSMYLGIPITLKTPDVIRVGSSLSAQRQLVTIVLHIQGKGYGVAPGVKNLEGSINGIYHPRLYLGESDEQRYTAILNMLLASAAFPGAFPAQKVRVCLNESTTCTFDESKDMEFIDGGIYENQPIKLAYQIKKRLGDNHKKSPMVFRHVDANGRGYPKHTKFNDDTDDSFIKTMIRTGVNFLDTSRNQELYSFIQEYPEARKKIMSTVSSYPRASDPWNAFFGFFDKGFREFDFLLGIYESEKETNSSDFGFLKQKVDYQIKDEDIGVEGSWSRYSCLKQYLDGVPSDKINPICESPELNNIKVLTQISLWRLYHVCNVMVVDSSKWVGCDALKPWKNIPVISEKYRDHIVFPKERQDIGQYFLRALSKLDYHFDKNEFKSNKSVNDQLRIKMQDLIDNLASRQNRREGRTVQALGTLSLNYFRYLSPRQGVYATFGDMSEFGWVSRKIPFSNGKEFEKLSLNVALNISRGQDTFKDDSETTFSPLIGGSYPLTSISSGGVQYNIGIAVGGVFAKNNDCQNADYICDGYLVRSTFGVSLMNFIQLNIYHRFNFHDEGHKSDMGMSLGFAHFF